ncbi:DNA translocase FtsK 4TM domain-containing protein [Candidatus Gracilibacteria bacterium]|nr:DNA translocase FtsK 4TM domain-containing protein [Candidatus Gracilibacteria bacterium]
MARRRRKSSVLRSFFLEKSKPKISARTAKALQLEVQAEVKNAIYGVVLMTLGALVIFSLFNGLGVFSILVKKALSPVIGYGVYFIPPMLILFGLFLLFNKDLRINTAKILGVFLFFVSILSILHLAIPVEQIFTIAKEGTHGGLIGYLTNFLLRDKLAISAVASAVIFVSIFLIATLLTFETAVIRLIASLFTEEETVTTSNAVKSAEKLPVVSKKVTKEEEGVQIIKPQFVTDEREVVQKATYEPDYREVEMEEAEETEQQKLPMEADPLGSNTLSTIITTWEKPSLDLLEDKSSEVYANDRALRSNAEKIRKKLEQFGIKVVMKNVHVGPTVIQYTLKPNEGVKLSRITTLKNDLALSLAAQSVRIEAPIPGKSLVGIEVPSEHRSTVYLREIMVSPQYVESTKTSKLICPLGRDVSGLPILADISDMPHLLIAGATGAGKSVGMNTILISLLYQNTPADLKLILIDPKRVELKDYNGIPHLLTPVVTDPDKAANALSWAVSEMNKRYNTLAQAGCRSIDEYNNDEGRVQKMPKIIIVIDELADLMLSNGKEVEASICRIAQMARAVGIHLIVATQRPSVDVITGLIKANIPTRISYAVTSSIDSRTILDAMGAEDLLGKGDMLYLPKDLGKPIRVQGIYISSKEIKRVTERLKLTMEPTYHEEVLEKQNRGALAGLVPGVESSDSDELYEDALRIVVENNKASASLLQRRLKVGYARAARLLDLLEENGVVGPVNGAKPREILVSRDN